MDKIIPDANRNFVINDIELDIDPIQLSVYKEGLQYSWKTLRTKASSKILNGNSVFHAKLNLIFTKSMFLKLHRLTVQLRNSPFVQVQNLFLYESINGKIAVGTLPICWFTVASCQIIPRSDSPYTVDVELDLRYLNYKAYQNTLKYKTNFESLPFTKEGDSKQYVYTFSSIPEENGYQNIEHEIDTTTKASTTRRSINSENILFRNIKNYNKSQPVTTAAESNAYKRYANFLQIKSLILNFGFTLEDLKKSFGNIYQKFDAREVTAVHEANATDYLYEKIYESFYGFTLQYKEFIVIKFDKAKTKALRKYIEDKVPENLSYNETTKKIEEAKLALAEEIKSASTLVPYQQEIKKALDQGYNIYTGRRNVNNVFYKTTSVSFGAGNLSPETLFSEALTNVSCGFNNLFSTLPISGQEFPVHQYLGSSEPLFNLQAIAKTTVKGGTGLSEFALELETFRRVTQSNAINFKYIPDSSYFAFDSFFTKLLQSTNIEVNVSDYSLPFKFLTRNLNVSTIEGMPGSQSIQFSFTETNDFIEEELNPVYTLGETDRTKDIISDSLNQQSFKREFYSKVSTSQNTYEPKNWKTTYFSSDPSRIGDFYYAFVRSGGNLSSVGDAEDRAAFDLCQKYLDPLQALFPDKDIYILGSIDFPSTGKRTTASKHYAGAAVDISIEGVSPEDIMREAYNLYNLSLPYGIIGYYKTEADFKEKKTLPRAGARNFFVHIDSRDLVTRNLDGTVEIDHASKSADVIYFDVADQRVDTINGSSIITYLTGGGVIGSYSPSSLQKEEQEIVQSLLANGALIETINSRINPFNPEREEISPQVKKYKDLTTAQQQLVLPYIDVDKDFLDETLITILDVQASANLNTASLQDNFEAQGLDIAVSGQQIYIPHTSQNRPIASSNEESKLLLRMYNEFQNLANVMLTEPIFYLDQTSTSASTEIDEEIRRIRKRLRDIQVTPAMVHIFQQTFAEKIDPAFLSKNQVSSSIAAGTGTFIALLYAPDITITKAAAAVLGAYLTASAALSYAGYNKYGKINYVRGQSILTEISRIKNIISYINKYSINLVDNVGDFKSITDINAYFDNLSNQDEVQTAFTNYINYLFKESKILDAFNNSSKDLKDAVNVSAALGAFDRSPEEANEEFDYDAKALTSETLFVGELRKIFEYLFGFPYTGSTKIRGLTVSGKEEDIEDLFEIDLNNPIGDVKAIADIEDYQYYSSRFTKGKGITSLQGPAIMQQVLNGPNKNFELPISKQELRANQEVKIGYLSNLLDEILSALSQDPIIKEAIGIQRRDNIFDLIEKNAYPDIDLPLDPVLPENNVNLHPTFFFHNEDENRPYNRDYISPELEKNIDYIVKKSFAFNEALEKGLFTGRSSSFVRGQYTAAEYPANELLLDSQDTGTASGKVYPEVQIQANETSVNKVITANKSLQQEIISLKDAFGDKQPASSTQPTLSEEDSLVKTAIDSCSYLRKSKKNIKRAFPTFKLYFIEEDAFESDRLSVFDDFYSYCGVKDFTVYENRKMPASTAVIKLQNISGVLDGTKPQVVRDIDVTQELLPEEEQEAQRAISSIIVRPGINIQLRAGYESNPNDLDIIFTGRITEVSNSSSGEMLEVTAQSFGVELIQKKLGLSKDDPLRNKTFNSTQALLGSLMLSEDLRHFGRIKKGRRFQYGEARNLNVQIESFKKKAFFESYTSGWIQDLFQNHSGKILLATIAFQYGSSIFKLGQLAVSSAFLKKTTEILTSTGTALKTATSSFAQQAIGRGSSGVIALLSTSSKLTSIPYISGVGQFATKIGSGLKTLGSGASKLIFKTIPVNVYKLITSLSNPNRANITALQQAFGGAQAGSASVELQRNIIMRALSKVIPKLNATTTTAIGSTAELEALAIKTLGYTAAATNGLVTNATATGLLFSGLSSSFAFTSFRFATNIFAPYAAIYTVSIIVDAILSALKYGINGMADLFKGLKPTSTKFLLSPQDDSIYPPELESYINFKDDDSGLNFFYNRIVSAPLSAAYDIYRRYGLGIIGFFTSFGEEEEIQEDASAIKTLLKTKQYLKDTRLIKNKSENEYNLEATTIWEVLHEMSLRHPGFVYGIRKYDTQLESRVFFGRPDQKYFTRDIKPEDVARLNKIDLALKAITSGDIIFNSATIEDIAGETVSKASNLELAIKTNQLLNYWIDKTKARVEPFRLYHSIDSTHDIIDNSLRVQNEKVFNQIAVNFRYSDISTSDVESVHKLRAVEYLSEEMVKEKGINYRNCKGFGGAIRYGMGELVNSAKDMYGGSILLVGRPEIKPNHVCVIADDYLNMHGLVEVEAVTHIFSHESGFVTEITPNAFVTANDKYTNTIASSVIAFESQRKLLDEYTSLSDILVEANTIDDDKLNALIEESIISYYSGTDSYIFNAIYGMLPFTDYSDARGIEDTKKQALEILRQKIRDRDLVFLDEFTKNISAAGFIDQAVGGTTDTLATFGGTITALINLLNLAERSSTGLLSSKTGLAIAAGTAIAGYTGLAGLVTSSLGIGEFSNQSLKTGKLGRNLFSDMLVSQISTGKMIKILPLVKDGRPIVAGGYESIPPRDRFKDVFGNFFNPVSDGVKNFLKYSKELEAEAELIGIKQYSKDFNLQYALGSIAETLVEKANIPISEDALKLYYITEGGE